MAEHTYASALWQSIAQGMRPLRAVRGMRDLLEREGRMALLPKIARALKRLAMRDTAQHAVVLSLPTVPKGRTSLGRDVRAALKDSGVTAKEITIQEDATLVGGWRLEGRGSLVDASYKKALLDIYKQTIAQ